MRLLRASVMSFIILSLLTGVFYPGIVTVLAQAIFPQQAGGSIVRSSAGVAIGSALIGQSFSGPGYFWTRPSATADYPYNAMASGGSNLGPTNRDLIKGIFERTQILRKSGMQGPLPGDMVTASGSGLDPHISAESALLQIPRIARERRLSEERVKALVDDHIERRQFGLLGADKVNVLKLNLALDGIGHNG